MTRGEKSRVFELIDRIRTDAKMIEEELDLIPEVRMQRVQETINNIMNTATGDSIKDRCFRNAARFVQNAIDGSFPDFEKIPEDGVYTQLVRCAECKHRYEYDGAYICDFVDYMTKDDDFCSKGERRDENIANINCAVDRSDGRDVFDGPADGR